jgi:hypothetical protein
MKIERRKIKTKMFIKNSKCTYVYIAWHRQRLWPVTWQTLPLVRENAPRQTKQQLSWLQPKSGHESRRGLDTKTDWLSDWLTDWLTDRPIVSCRVTLTLTVTLWNPQQTTHLTHNDLRIRCLPVRGRYPSSEIAAPEEQGSPHHCWTIHGAHRPVTCMWLSKFRMYMT